MIGGCSNDNHENGKTVSVLLGENKKDKVNDKMGHREILEEKIMSLCSNHLFI